MLLTCGVGEDSWESLGLQGRSNHSILNEISPGCSLEGLMLKLKVQYFGQLIRRVDSLEKTLMLGGIRGRRRREWQRKAGWHHWLDGRESEWTPGVGDGQGGLACCDSWGRRVGHDLATDLILSDSHWVISDSLQPHGLQHTRLPSPSPTPGAYSNSCPLSQWCHPTISSSVVPFNSCLQSFPH